MIKAFIQGNLVSNPESRQISEGKRVVVLVIASNRPGKDAPDILRVEVWGTSADACMKYLKKGSGVCASGDLNIDLYDKNDEKRVAVKLVNAQVEFTDRKPQTEAK